MRSERRLPAPVAVLLACACSGPVDESSFVENRTTPTPGEQGAAPPSDVATHTAALVTGPSLTPSIPLPARPTCTLHGVTGVFVGYPDWVEVFGFTCPGDELFVGNPFGGGYTTTTAAPSGGQNSPGFFFARYHYTGQCGQIAVLVYDLQTPANQGLSVTVPC